MPFCLQYIISFYSNNKLFKLQDKVGTWFSNPGAGKAESGAAGSGGVGKYLKARNAHRGSRDSTENGSSLTKKRKVGGSAGEYGNFSSW